MGRSGLARPTDDYGRLSMTQMYRASLVFAVGMLALAPAAFAQNVDDIDPGTTAWMLVSTALVLLMIPGLAMFYGGLVRTKNVLGTMMHSFVPLAIVGVLWTIV